MSRDSATVSNNMRKIHSKDTSIELLLRKALWHKGYRYRKNYKALPGSPDIVLTKYKIAIFCDGDFWHGHNWAVRGMASLEEELNSYSEFWRSKILSNIERDSKNTLALTESGWIVIRLWESDIRKDLTSCITTIIETYKQRIQGE